MIRRDPIPYGMFTMNRTMDQLRSWRILEGVYHKGQAKAWDGKVELEAALARHGGIQLDPQHLKPIKRLFAVIFWGELAAWKISAELALELEPLEAKMAATAQAHDESRHFYVLHDYLALLGYTPEQLPDSASRVLAEVVGAKTLARKLLGMQLMVEPIALTFFQMVREKQIDPVLCDLLKLYERDEARHVALGVHFLPRLLETMGPIETLRLWRWQMRMFMIQLDGLSEMEEDFRALGFSPRDALRLGIAKQTHAAQLLLEQLPTGIDMSPVFERLIEARLELEFPPEGHDPGLPARVKRALHAALHGAAEKWDPGVVMAA